MFVQLTDNKTVLSIDLRTQPPTLIAEHKMEDKITKIRPFQQYFRVVLKQNGDILLLYCGDKSIDESCVPCENIENGTVLDFALNE